jgi:hypothetical protein
MRALVADREEPSVGVADAERCPAGESRGSQLPRRERVVRHALETRGDSRALT